MKTQTVESNKNNSIHESRYGIALKKTQTQIALEMENLESWVGTSKVSIM